MKKTLIITALLSFTTLLFSQNNDAKYVVGVEAGSIFRSYKQGIGTGINYSYGINFEYPVGKFSLGAGLLQTNYGRKKYKAFTGNSFLNDDGDKRFNFAMRSFSIRYITLSNRLQYRLPCNCVYLHLGYNLDILTQIDKKDIRNTKIKNTSEEPYLLEEEADLKNINPSFEFGIGLKMHFSETGRIFMRPSYVLMSKPSKNENQFYSEDFNFLKVVFGVQFGIN